MPKQYAKLRIFSDTAGTVSDAVGTLKIIDDTYLHLYAANTYFDEILNAHHGHRRFFRIELIEAGLIPWGFHTRNAVTSQEIRTHLLLAEDQLVLSAVRFESPGFWEVLGSLNPLEQLRKFINDCHERKKDKEYRNAADKRRKELENELLAIQVFKEKTEALQKLGYSEEEIRRILLPTAKALNHIAIIHDQGLITNAEIKGIENKADK